MWIRGLRGHLDNCILKVFAQNPFGNLMIIVIVITFIIIVIIPSLLLLLWLLLSLVTF